MIQIYVYAYLLNIYLNIFVCIHECLFVCAFSLRILFLPLLQLEFIKNENTISISMEGQNLGRGGTLAWFSVATTSIIFLFDMAKIGAGEALEKGLGDVLKDNAVLKVVHDCRAMEDILHHQFGINLNNVFDTQVSFLQRCIVFA